MTSWREYIKNCIENYPIVTFKFQDGTQLGVGVGEHFDKDSVYCAENVINFIDIGQTIDYPYHSIVKIIKYGEIQ